MIITKAELLKKHPLYDVLLSSWRFYSACYDGINAMIAEGILAKHDRESVKNFESRKKEAFDFGYSKAIVDIFNFYTHEKETKNNYSKLGQDELFQQFLDDSDLWGTSWEDFLRTQSKNASIYGHVGILVDKPQGKVANREEAKKGNLYPYATAFMPPAILDWKVERNEQGRPELSMVKLLEDGGSVLLWTKDEWQRWDIKDSEARALGSGVNPLQEIPFYWFYNFKHREIRNIGISDLTRISYIEASMVRNLSHGEEVIKYAAFPMLRKPYPKQVAGAQNDDVVGVTGVLEFDPQLPDSKPDWLPSSVGEPITAMLSWLELKIIQIYRAANTGGVQSVEATRYAKSGEALKREFQLLNSVLTAKSKSEIEAELWGLYYWTKWQGIEQLYDDVTIDRSTDYSIADLSTELENALTGKALIKSPTFNVELQQRLVRQLMPGLDNDTQEVIDAEIEQAVGVKEKTEPAQTGSQDSQTVGQVNNLTSTPGINSVNNAQINDMIKNLMANTDQGGNA